jgi:hypothetical protein
MPQKIFCKNFCKLGELAEAGAGGLVDAGGFATGFLLGESFGLTFLTSLFAFADYGRLRYPLQLLADARCRATSHPAFLF